MARLRYNAAGKQETGVAGGWSVIKVALRAAVWKATPAPIPVGATGLIACAALAAAAGLAAQYVEAGEGPAFNPYGFNAGLAWLVLALTVASLFVRSEERSTALAAMLALVSAINLGRIVVAIAAIKVAGVAPHVAQSLIVVVGLVWATGALHAILRSVEPEHSRGRLVRVAGLWLALLVAYAAVPHVPVFRDPGFDIRFANLWEYVAAKREGRDQAAPPRTVQQAQAELMERAVGRLAPQTQGKTDIYAIGIAGWGEQDVFVKEVDGALDAIAKSLPIEGRVLRLVNHPATASHTPMATQENFSEAVHAVAGIMDKSEDVLLLFMTSHGSAGGIALQLPNVYSTLLAPADVAATLDREGIRHRVVIVSACYSGIYLNPLANDDTIVLTAADEKNASFGCSSERDWTYFGDALFNRSLAPGSDLQQAFFAARTLIAAWETRDRVPPSNPQAHFGRNMMDKLRPLYAAGERPVLQAPPTWLQGVMRPLGP